MDQNEDFPQLRSLLASTKLDFPQDTQVDQFLAEFHRRQRAQLLVRESIWSRAFTAVKERFAGIQLGPSLSYASVVAVVAVMAVMGLSQQVQVTDQPGAGIKLSFGTTSRDSTFALLPGTFSSTSPAPQVADNLNFAPAHTDTATTRFMLGNNAHGAAYDSTVAF